MKPDVHFFSLLDDSLVWTAQWYKLYDARKLVPRVVLDEQSVVPLNDVGAVAFWIPKAQTSDVI